LTISSPKHAWSTRTCTDATVERATAMRWREDEVGILNPFAEESRVRRRHIAALEVAADRPLTQHQLDRDRDRIPAMHPRCR
jgi:hypothetical protein